MESGADAILHLSAVAVLRTCSHRWKYGSGEGVFLQGKAIFRCNTLRIAKKLTRHGGKTAAATAFADLWEQVLNFRAKNGAKHMCFAPKSGT